VAYPEFLAELIAYSSAPIASISISIDRMAEPTTDRFRLRVHRFVWAVIQQIAFLRDALSVAV
jgi:hypothetical protein